MKYLCDMCGIPCLYVRGHIYGDFGKPHAWNMVLADDQVFYVDATWDEMGMNEGGEVASSVAGHAWFTADAAKFDKSHWTGYSYSEGELNEFTLAGGIDEAVA